MKSGLDNFIQPFHLKGGAVRGCLLRVGRVVSDCLAPHDLPLPVAKLVAEAVALGVALSSSLKYEGLFTLQARGGGPVRALVADITSAGMIRAIARYDRDDLPRGENPPLKELMGQGVLSFTVDQGAHTERYQGIVALEGETLGEAVLAYLDRSEQVPTRLAIAIAPPADPDEMWRVSALMIQKMPDDPSSPEVSRALWETAGILMETLKPEELSDFSRDPKDLLYHLFNEEEPRVSPLRPLFFGCRCSREKVLNALASLPAEDREDLMAKGDIDVTCEFCGTHHILSPENLTDYISAHS